MNAMTRGEQECAGVGEVASRIWIGSLHFMVSKKTSTGWSFTTLFIFGVDYSMDYSSLHVM